MWKKPEAAFVTKACCKLRDDQPQSASISRQHVPGWPCHQSMGKKNRCKADDYCHIVVIS
jgi:hypothetical protein